MTPPAPLSASPLCLHGHRFTEVSLRASKLEKPEGGFSLQTTRTLESPTGDPGRFLLILTVVLGSNTPDEEAPYEAALTVEGDFEVAEAYPAAKREDLVNITGASMLYGACREMLANLTARSVHGMSTLPSISFAASDVDSREETSVKKVAKRKK